MLLNFSNHPLDHWSEEQIETARSTWGRIQDLPFPQVPPEEDEEVLKELATTFLSRILLALDQESDSASAVHIMGEQTLCFPVIRALQRRGILCVASTTHRSTIESEEGKLSYFQFVRFRAYPQFSL